MADDLPEPSPEKALADFRLTGGDLTVAWLLVRLENTDPGRELAGGDKPFAELARSLGYAPAALLIWLRAGMPYVSAGDWQTGDGFVLRTHWTLDWLTEMRPRVWRASPEAAQRLAMLMEV